VACVVATIWDLGLEVFPEKSEAMWLCKRADYGTPPAGYRLRLVGIDHEVGTWMKYPGLTLSNFFQLCPTISNSVQRRPTLSKFFQRRRTLSNDFQLSSNDVQCCPMMSNFFQ
jgi:hypothetical protein